MFTKYNSVKGTEIRLLSSLLTLAARFKILYSVSDFNFEGVETS